MTIAGAVNREGVAFSPDGAMYVTPAPGGTISGNTFSQTTLNSNVCTTIQQGGVPLIHPGSFTANNNGAIVLGTALNKSYLNCYVYLLAGDIAAGVPGSAGYYFAQFSSTTAATVFNNAWNGSGVAPLVTSPTAFVTTGAGARTGDTAAETFLSVSIPVLAANSQIYVTLNSIQTNSAGTKTFMVLLGGTQLHGVTANSIARSSGVFMISNTGATNKQIGQSGGLTGFTVSSQEGNAAIDTSVATTLTANITRGTATDNVVILPPVIEVSL